MIRQSKHEKNALKTPCDDALKLRSARYSEDTEIYDMDRHRQYMLD